MLTLPTWILTGNVLNDRLPVLLGMGILSSINQGLSVSNCRFHFQYLAIIPLGSHAYKYFQMEFYKEKTSSVSNGC